MSRNAPVTPLALREGTEVAHGHLPASRAGRAHSHVASVREDLKMKKLFAILALSATLLTAAACNTVRGAGRDAQSAANAVDNEM
jgi:predicted small secreted protein